ncbi:hypothetical protein [Embleya sp. NPDC005575]|uniref:hypothetical protein n=1 Tax=Embleya sp. NPDC005575 TaxID=3156892 RepID=UPI0033B569EC
MFKKLESMGDSLLERFAPKVDAAAAVRRCWSWPACYQCQNQCGYHASCSRCDSAPNLYICDC